jgi:polar amino acid transport system permease protein
MMPHVWDFSPVWDHFPVILEGLRVTFLLTLVSCAVGAVVGLVTSIGLTARRSLISVPITAVVELVRACPPLVMLIWAYYMLPTLTGVGFSSFATAAFVFAITFAAFSADIFRGSIEAIPPATRDSALALGMTRAMVLRRVVIPEVFRRSFPAVNALVVSTLKMSSLASVIAVGDLMYNASLILALRSRPFEIYTAIAAAYIVVIFPIVFALRWLESRPWSAVFPKSE